MTREELQRAVQARIQQLRTLNDRAAAEHRDLTPAEDDQVTLLRSEIADFSLQLTRPTQPGREDPAQAVARSADIAAQIYGNRDLNRTWGEDDEDPTSIQRVAHDVAEAVRNRQSIQRAITLPAGWVTGAAIGGDPLDVVDLSQFFTVRPVTGTTADVLRFDATDGEVVAEGAPKPDVVTGTLVPARVQKIAGMAIVTTEGLTFVDGAQQAITNVLRGSIIAGQNREIMEAVEAGGTPQAFVTDAITTVLTMAANIGTKAQPSVIVANPADYVGLVLKMAAMPQNISMPQIVVSDDATAGSVTVAARSGVVVARTQVGVLIDPYTLAHENKTRLIAEMFMVASVVRPNVVMVGDVVATP